MIAAADALQRLREGNARFVANLGKSRGLSRSFELSPDVQTPFAIILGCSDARVPAEIIFDQGLGDLFVIRVAGNIVAPSQIGSIEFSAEAHKARLVVVLGHSQCGAINATIDQLLQPQGQQSRNLQSIVDRVRPSVEVLMDTDVARDRSELVRRSVRNNIRMSVNQLRHGSSMLERMISEEGLRIVGAEYSLETGQVSFMDEA